MYDKTAFNVFDSN